jgi:hypothetical protein
MTCKVKKTIKLFLSKKTLKVHSLIEKLLRVRFPGFYVDFNTFETSSWLLKVLRTGNEIGLTGVVAVISKNPIQIIKIETVPGLKQECLHSRSKKYWYTC